MTAATRSRRKGQRSVDQARALRGIESKANGWVDAHRLDLANCDVKAVSVYVTPGAPELITADLTGGNEDETGRFVDQLVYELTPESISGLTDATGQRAFTFCV